MNNCNHIACATASRRLNVSLAGGRPDNKNTREFAGVRYESTYDCVSVDEKYRRHIGTRTFLGGFARAFVEPPRVRRVLVRILI